MYTVVNIKDIEPIASNKALSKYDGVFLVDDKTNKITFEENDPYGYKSLEFLTQCSSTIQSIGAKLDNTETEIKTTYLLDMDLIATYVPQGTIKQYHVQNVLDKANDNGFLTISKANAIKAELIAKIKQLKNHYLNEFTVYANNTFIKQQQVSKDWQTVDWDGNKGAQPTSGAKPLKSDAEINVSTFMSSITGLLSDLTSITSETNITALVSNAESISTDGLQTTNTIQELSATIINKLEGAFFSINNNVLKNLTKID